MTNDDLKKAIMCGYDRREGAMRGWKLVALWVVIILVGISISYSVGKLLISLLIMK